MSNSTEPNPGASASVIRPNDVPLETGVKHRLTHRRLIRRDLHGSGLSVTWIALHGRHTRSLCRESDRVYYILAGSADFVLGDAPPERATAGDCIFIPRGTAYSLEGEVDYLVMNGPAFRPGSDEYLE
jgi:mannose-6-phosphate isomerase-like protein (cupin superfamily)